MFWIILYCLANIRTQIIKGVMIVFAQFPNQRYKSFYFCFSQSHLYSNHRNFFLWNFLWYLSTSVVNFFNQTTRRTLRTPSWWSLTKKNRATHNFIKDIMTRKVPYFTLWRIFDKSAKKLKMKSQDLKNFVFDQLLWKCFKNVLFWVLWLQF